MRLPHFICGISWEKNKKNSLGGQISNENGIEGGLRK
jgi:hypothetical protein